MISEDRLHHIIGVARKAYKLAIDLGYDEQYARQMFAIGWNHDIGYEFDPEHHQIAGAESLKDWKYSFYIKTHGHVEYDKWDNPKIDLSWFIINYADLTTSPTGEEVTLDERLAEIESRYGKEHTWYKETKEVIDILKQAKANLEEWRYYD